MWKKKAAPNEPQAVTPVLVDETISPSSLKFSLAELREIKTRDRLKELHQQYLTGQAEALEQLVQLLRSCLAYKISESEGLDGNQEFIVCVAATFLLDLAKQHAWELLDQIAGTDLGIFKLGITVELERSLKERLDSCFEVDGSITLAGIEQIKLIHRRYYLERKQVTEEFFLPYGRAKLTEVITLGKTLSVLLLLSSDIWQFKLDKYHNVVKGLVMEYLNCHFGDGFWFELGHLLWLETVMQKFGLGSLSDREYHLAQIIPRYYYRGAYNYRPHFNEKNLLELKELLARFKLEPQPVMRDLAEKLILTADQNCCASEACSRVKLADIVREEYFAADEAVKEMFAPAISILARYGHLSEALNLCQKLALIPSTFVHDFKQGLICLVEQGNLLQADPAALKAQLQAVQQACNLTSDEIGQLLFRSLVDSNRSPEQCLSQALLVVRLGGGDLWRYLVDDDIFWDRFLVWKKRSQKQSARELEIAIVMFTAFLRTDLDQLPPPKPSEREPSLRIVKASGDVS
jgi:hypothetical protein